LRGMRFVCTRLACPLRGGSAGAAARTKMREKEAAGEPETPVSW